MSKHVKTDGTYLMDAGGAPVLAPDATPFDLDDPRSVANIVPNEIREKVINLPIKFFKYNEWQLKKQCKPTPELSRLRLSFWDEYGQAQDGNRKMNVISILKGCCTPHHFYEVILKDPNKIGYILIPPKDYMLAQRDMHEMAWDQMRKVLSQNFIQKIPMKDKIGNQLYGEDGKPLFQKKIDHQLIGKMIAITNMLDLRVKGAIVQRVQVQSQSQSHITTTNQSLSNSDMGQLEAMESRVLSLKKELEQLDAAKDENVFDAETFEGSGTSKP